jgi:hypothetical protein
VLKFFLWGKLLLLYVSLRCARMLCIKKQNRQLKATGSNTPSTTYVSIEGTHTIAAVFPTKNFNTWGWPYWPKHVVFLRNFKNFKSLKNNNCECEELTSVCTQRRTDCNWVESATGCYNIIPFRKLTTFFLNVGFSTFAITSQNSRITIRCNSIR